MAIKHKTRIEKGNLFLIILKFFLEFTILFEMEKRINIAIAESQAIKEDSILNKNLK